MQDNWKAKRLARKLTLRQVEAATGISNAYLSQLENGKIADPGYSIVMKLSEYYGQPIEPESPKCPSCWSENMKDLKIQKHNGVFGPGAAVSTLFECKHCQNCGTLFIPPIVLSEPPKPSQP